MTLGVKKIRRDRDDKAASIAEVTKEQTKRLNVEIPKSKHDALKKAAIDHGKTMAELVNEFLNDGLRKVK